MATVIPLLLFNIGAKDTRSRETLFSVAQTAKGHSLLKYGNDPLSVKKRQSYFAVSGQASTIGKGRLGQLTLAFGYAPITQGPPTNLLLSIDYHINLLVQLCLLVYICTICVYLC